MHFKTVKMSDIQTIIDEVVRLDGNRVVSYDILPNNVWIAILQASQEQGVPVENRYGPPNGEKVNFTNGFFRLWKPSPGLGGQ